VRRGYDRYRPLRSSTAVAPQKRERHQPEALRRHVRPAKIRIPSKGMPSPTRSRQTSWWLWLLETAAVRRCRLRPVTRVIAVGASALADGQPNGTGSFDRSANSPANIRNRIRSTAHQARASRGASALGIVAPGGDPNGNTDNDDLHWVEKIFGRRRHSMRVTRARAPDDYPNSTGTTPPVDCRTFIRRNSMAHATRCGSRGSHPPRSTQRINRRPR